MKADRFLEAQGLVSESPVVESEKRFPDGAHFRIEIPSVENPQVLRAVLAEAKERGLVVNRVSQGSGAMMLTERELNEMARIAEGSALKYRSSSGREKAGTSESNLVRLMGPPFPVK